MSNELQRSLPERAKEFLQVEGERSLFELAELLRQYRNDTHPDRFQDQELKKQAEIRFKDAQALLDELEPLGVIEFVRSGRVAIIKDMWQFSQNLHIMEQRQEETLMD